MHFYPITVKINLCSFLHPEDPDLVAVIPVPAGGMARLVVNTSQTEALWLEGVQSRVV